HVDEIEIKDPQTGKTLRRVPEVIDCWFDSGAMPYAQWGWPEKGKAEFERYFPADFISEAIDQTRGWFYTLLSISTMVSDAPAYKNVVCLGHVVDEKGEKMSKSKGNVVDPFSVFDTHGADGIRWYFLTNSPPGHSRRVGKPGTDHDPVNIVHGFFNMLMNSVGFFIMYANVDGIRIQSDWEANPIQGAPPFADRPEIDRWILSALTDLIDTVGKALDTYDCQSAGKAMEDFVDGLSNWYIRRNRRRFWKGDLDADKLAAYATLYECLTAIARMMAPFTPFLSEDLYRLLVSDVVADAPESVHLAGWPAHHAGQYDAGALRAGDLIKQAAYLGRAARMQSAIKVRQPLGRMMIHLDEKADRQLIAQNEAVLCEELNVKHIEYLDDSAGILDYRVKPNLPRIGKALGPRVREVQQYLQQADAREIALAVRKGQTVIIPAANAEPIELEPDDILIESVSKEGTSGAEGRGMLVALDTTLTDELIQEGYARDLVRNIQELRKNSGLEVTDRIGLSIEVGEGKLSADLNKAIQTHVAYIEGETLAQLQSGPRPGNIDGQENVRIEKHPVEIALWK
ncbi:MAG: class I tRNA ligase family protein, partial [Leptospiraceae bacterium]|nr:class I tRNA ligase family protein [Leptospiraceae bacterium]